MEARKATIGTVIHATLRNIDLLEAFTEELEALDEFDCHTDTILECKAHIANNAEDEQGWSSLKWEEQADYLVNELLIDALNDLALPYTYFGCTEGNGSDFGFWPSLSSLEEDVQMGEVTTDLTQVPEFYVEVNDHGNTTLFQFDQDDRQYKIVWEIV